MIGRGLFGSSTRKKTPFGAPFDAPTYGTPGIGDDFNRRQQEVLALPEQGGASQQPDFQPSAGPISQAIGQPNPPQISDADREREAVLGMLGTAPQKQKGNFGRDWLAPALAVIGDGLSEAGGGRGGRGGYSAVDMLMKQQAEKKQGFADQQAAYERNMRVANLPGMNQREFAAFQMDPKAWGGSMSRAATSRYEAATLNPGDTRYLGQGNGSFEAPTRAHQYATDLGLDRGTDPYRDAVRDQELGSNGPTAFGNDQFLENAKNLARANLERQRQSNRMGLEGARQGNRMAVRGAPTYRDTNGAPPRAGGPPASAPRKAAARTATDANGNKVQWNGSAWVPAR